MAPALCFELIPSVSERSALFVKELCSHRRRQTDDDFSTGTRLKRAGIAGRSVDSVRWTPLQKQETKRIGGGSPVASLMPKSVLSGGRKYQLLRE